MAFSLAILNKLPKEERDPLYLKLIPPSVFRMFRLDSKTLTNPSGERVVTGIFPTDENFACVDVKYRPEDRDCIFSCQVSLEMFMQSLYLDFVTINDPFSERFNVDKDELGRDTLFGTRSRNIPEEVRALDAGLAPGMVRRGLRLVGEFMDCLEAFAQDIGLKAIGLRALYYHHAILWERHGFIYFRGMKIMEKIHNEFQIGGLLYQKLDGSTPFRRREMDKTVRGRSWALYDGIYSEVFGEDWESPSMYKMIGKETRANTFPDQIY
jgi:hypothetical protein